MREELKQISDKFESVAATSYVHFSLSENTALMTLAINKTDNWYIVKDCIDKGIYFLHNLKAEFILNPNLETFEFRFKTAKEALQTYEKYLDKE
jgi:hypothetical protein